MWAQSGRRIGLAAMWVGLGLACSQARAPVDEPPGCEGICASAGVQNATLIVEPDAGDAPVLQAIASAQKNVRLEVYLLTARSVIDALKAAAQRGVTVQVMLEANPVGEGSNPTPTLNELHSAGVQTKTANPAYKLTHAKLLVIDETSAFIGTANYTKSALGGSSSTVNRDFIVVDSESDDVRECIAIFDADWNRTTPTLTNEHLVVSPVNARDRITALVNGAKSSLLIEEEGLSDYRFIDALIAARQRGVEVTVVVPASDATSADGTGAARLTRGGVPVLEVTDAPNGPLYIHAKTVVADQTLAFVGSENASTSGLDSNREVGVIVGNPSLIEQLTEAIQHDAATGEVFVP